MTLKELIMQVSFDELLPCLKMPFVKRTIGFG